MTRMTRMIHDFHAYFQIERKNPSKAKKEIDGLTRCSERYSEVKDALSRMMLLTTARAINKKLPNKREEPDKIDPKAYASVGERGHSSGLKVLIRSNGEYNKQLQHKLSELKSLGMSAPINFSLLPKGSWLLEFPLILSKPFLSKDDIPFYIIDNPIRKDKAFGIPFISATSWKGNLRWTMMKLFLEPSADKPEDFARIRFQHTLLFGMEKGWNETKGWTDYLDNLCPSAKERYRHMLTQKFTKTKKSAKDVHVKGMLQFYPSFWNEIDMLVINPHDRRTKTGKDPIYFEVVPEGATSFFQLAYIPLYWLDLPDEELIKKVIEDLKAVIAGLREMMLTYGFSAKKSSGFGVIKNGWDKSESRIEIKEFYSARKFSNFEELEKAVRIWEEQE